MQQIQPFQANGWLQFTRANLLIHSLCKWEQKSPNENSAGEISHFIIYSQIYSVNLERNKWPHTNIKISPGARRKKKMEKWGPFENPRIFPERCLYWD